MEADAPEVPILLLGEPGVGKSTFLSRLTLGNFGVRPGKDASARRHPPKPLPILRDMDQPFTFEVRFGGRPYRLEFADTASPQHYTLLRPDIVVLCFDISRRSTLAAVRTRWKGLVETHFNHDERMPVVLLGLKRDLRQQWTEEQMRSVVATGAGVVSGDNDAVRGGSVMPHEALAVAQAMMLDRYAECSAATGELCQEVLEDLSRAAVMTMTEKGGRSDGTQCAIL